MRIYVDQQQRILVLNKMNLKDLNPATRIQKSKYTHGPPIKFNRINDIDLHDCSCITLLSNCSEM